MNYLTFCAIFKKEHHWLEEWLLYHEHLGAEHFYLWCNDHGEERDLAVKILTPYITRGLVTLFFEDSREYVGHQVGIYEKTACEFMTKTRWMGLFDLDEFLLPAKTDDLRIFLSDYEEYDALAATWCIFGSGGYEHSPPGQINHFLYRARPERRCNTVIKSFIQPKYLEIGKSQNTHYFVTQRTPTVDAHYRIVRSMEAETNTEELIRINHYMIRSRDWFFHVKSRRCEILREKLDMRNWYTMDLNEVFDDEISTRFGHIVRNVEQKTIMRGDNE